MRINAKLSGCGMLVLVCSVAAADVVPKWAVRDQAGAERVVAQLPGRADRNPDAQAYVEDGDTRVDGDTLRDATRPGAVTCPPPYLCGQDSLVGAGTWLYSDMAFSSGTNSGRITSNDFPPPREALLTTPVGIISFDCAYIDSSSNGCDKPHRFTVCFYTSDPNGVPILPAQVTFTNQVPALEENVGAILFSGGTVEATHWRFTILLPTPVYVQLAPYYGKGTFSVSSDDPTTGCWCLLGPAAAGEGNGSCYRWWNSNPAGMASTANDWTYCFAENKQGACCDDCDPGNCLSASNQFLCNQLGWRFAAEQTCATMTPLCGDASGACCRDDGTCTVISCPACDLIPDAYWDGVGTTCADCCVVVGDGDDKTEGEPPCADNYVDVFNGGCDAASPVFSALACGTTVCGESGTFRSWTCCKGDANCDGQVDFGDINAFVDCLVWGICCDSTCCVCDLSSDGEPHVGFEDINPFVELLTTNPLPIPCPTPRTPTFAARDMDWYQYTTTQPYTLTFAVHAEFEARIWIIAAQSDCTAQCDYAFTASGPRCSDPTIVTRCVPAGEYYFGVAPEVFESVACGADYKATLTCTPCEPCMYVCDPNAPGYMLENEPCGLAYDVNGGCGDPNTSADDLFTDLTFVEIPVGSGFCYATVCAESFAGEEDPNTGSIYRDLDWYRYNLTTVADVEFDVDTEVPLIMTPLSANAAGNPWYCGAPLYGYWTRHQDPCNELAPLVTTIENGTNYIFVGPESADGDPLFAGYPCCSGDYTYVLFLTYLCGGGCPDLIDCNDVPEIAENEPACYDGYFDSYNGGCDVAAPHPMMALPVFECEWYICGISGSYHQTTDPNSPFVYDADWYTFSLSADSYLCVEGLTNLPIDVDIYGPSPTCATLDSLHVFDSFFAACADYDQDPVDPDPNTPGRQQCAAGNYWMRVALREGFTDVTCALGWEYYITLTCEQNCPDTK